jgi:hypothetical protein
VALFGISPAEQTALNEARLAFQRGVEQLHLTHYALVEPSPGANPQDHRELAFRLPPLTNEIPVLQTQYESVVTTILGQNRARLFLEPAGVGLHASLGQWPFVERTIKLIAHRQPDGQVAHQLETRIGRGAMTSSPVYYPLEAGSALWPFRYLFGEAPLLADQPAPANPAQ